MNKTAGSGRNAAQGPQQHPELKHCVLALHRWYEAHQRKLPWREIQDPYGIWVSEVMLQQTQVATVIPYYERWMQRFFDLQSLAAVEVEVVLKLWEGLGYYRRARNLHRAAGQLVEAGYTNVPHDPEVFRRLSGVGAYTEAAVMSIAYGANMAVVDGNVRRVIGRLIALDQPVAGSRVQRMIEKVADELLIQGSASKHNQAMMELGALICTPRNPTCGRCPMSHGCLARLSGDPERFPPKKPRPKTPLHRLAVAVLRDERGMVLIRRRPYDGLLGGLWECPAWPVEQQEQADEAVDRGLKADFGLDVRHLGALQIVKHAYSHFKVQLYPQLVALRGGAGIRAAESATAWADPQELGAHPMHRASLKVLECLAKGPSA